MKRQIRLLAVDIDGTLLNPAFEISSADLTALRRAHESGIEIILVTGRRHAFALPIAEKLGFYDHLWLISSNGAITRSFSGETFHRDLLPVETARQLAAEMNSFRGNMVVTFDQETKGALLVEQDHDLTGSIERWMKSNMQYLEFVSSIETALTRDPVQAMFCGGVERMRQAQRALLGSDVKPLVTVLRTEYPHRDLCIMDVLNRDCSKGHAVKRWAEYRGLQPAEVMAIGDNYNDVEMLEFAGLPVVMGNAADELKQNGWHVTLPNDQSGVAAALENLVQL